MPDPWLVADADVVTAMAGSVLGTLPSELVGRLLAVGDRTEYPAGSTIYRPGAAPRTLLVVRGLLRVYMSSPEGRQVTVRYVREREVLGLALMVGGPADVDRPDAVRVHPVPDRRRDVGGGGARRWPRGLDAGRGTDPLAAGDLAADRDQHLRLGSAADRRAPAGPGLCAAASPRRPSRPGITAGTCRCGRVGARGGGSRAAGLPSRAAGGNRHRTVCRSSTRPVCTTRSWNPTAG